MREFRLATYRRISGHADQLRGHSLESQEAEIMRFATAHNGRIVHEFSDTKPGFCLTDADYERIIRLARRHEIDAVLMEHLDRFGRDNGEAIKRCDQLADRYGVQIWSVQQGVDVPKETRDIVLCQASWESRNKSKHVLPKMRFMVQQGLWPSRPPFGYVMDESRRYPNGDRIGGYLIVAEPLRPIVVELFRRAAGGETLYSLANWLNDLYHSGRKDVRPPGTRSKHRDAPDPWYTTTVSKILQNRVYCGYVTFNKRSRSRFRPHGDKNEDEWDVVKGQHEALVSEEQFEQIQRSLTLHRHRRALSGSVANAGRQFVLNGLIYCGECGRPAHGHWGHGNRYDPASGRDGRTVLYRCAQNRHPSAGGARVHAYVLDQLERVMFDPVRVQQVLDQLAGKSDEPAPDPATALRRERASLEENITRVGRAVAEGGMPPEDYSRIVAPYKARLADVNAKLTELAEVGAPQQMERKIRKYTAEMVQMRPLIERALASKHAESLDLATEALRGVIRQITYRKGEDPVIEWEPWVQPLLVPALVPTHADSTADAQAVRPEQRILVDRR